MFAHLFGTISSPSCANFALRKCAHDDQKHFSVHATNTMFNSINVDDCLVSVNTEEEAVALYKELSMRCAKGGFQLTKSISNNAFFLLPYLNRKEPLRLRI